MKNEVERLLKGRGSEVKNNKNLTEKLRKWRSIRNISKANYLVFVGNILEELLEPCYNKELIEQFKEEILEKYFHGNILYDNTEDIVDAIQDIQVFCINETELMGYDNIKCNDEVFSEINSREQDPLQKIQWRESYPFGKWQKRKDQNPSTLYKANYESCKL